MGTNLWHEQHGYQPVARATWCIEMQRERYEQHGYKAMPQTSCNDENKAAALAGTTTSKPVQNAVANIAVPEALSVPGNEQH